MAVTLFLHGALGQVPVEVNVGDSLQVTKDCYDEAELNRFVLSRRVHTDDIVEVNDVIHNHYGTFVVVRHKDNLLFFIKPCNLTPVALG